MKGLYIHIPFCVSKCAYCDFCSYANIKPLRQQYVKALIKELTFYKNKYKNFEPKTLYIGGGTPSFLTSAQLSFLLKNIFLTYNKFKELTFEANPESLSLSKIKILKNFGINRLSIGLQSSFDKHLKTIGRAHNFEQFLKVYNVACRYFDNINIDIIAGLPKQNLDDFKDTIKTILTLKPKHISIYGLQVEEGTPLYKSGYVCDDELCRKMLEFAESELIKNKYNHYEISNFALKGKESKHNINYWRSGEYLGLGVSASSYIKGTRWQNTTDVKDYIYKIKKGKNVIIFEESLEGKAKVGEEILLAFRELEGFKPSKKMIKYFEKDFNVLFAKKLIIKEKEKIKLSEEGKYFANVVFRHFVEPF